MDNKESMELLEALRCVRVDFADGGGGSLLLVMEFEIIRERNA